MILKNLQHAISPRHALMDLNTPRGDGRDAQRSLEDA